MKYFVIIICLLNWEKSCDGMLVVFMVFYWLGVVYGLKELFVVGVSI